MINIFKTFLILFSISATVSTFAQVPTKAEDVSPLLIGEKLPEASLQNADGKVLKLSTILSQKPTVMIFYRGGWCPYCNKQLSGLVDIEKEILELGYQIVAISPDDYKNLKNTEEKEKIKYSVLSDQGGKFIKEINGNSKEIRINHINLVNGGYLLKIYKKEEILTKKVLK